MMEIPFGVEDEIWYIVAQKAAFCKGFGRKKSCYRVNTSSLSQIPL
jgi:hypothetical protein